jgi:hypothetical protein
MDNFVAGIFPNQEQAFTANAALLQLATGGALRMESAGVYARDVLGDFTLEDAGPGTAQDLEFADGGAGQEALSELDEATAEGAHVVLVHVNETDPSALDAAIGSNGGTVWRRSVGELTSAANQRFADAS